jgi:hypothetical protein
MNRRTLFARAALILTLAFAGLAGGTAPAQTVQIGHQNVNLATLPLFPPEAVPRLGTFFSIHRAGGPPLPGLPPAYATAGLPVYWLGGNRYLVDDTSLDWATIEAERRLAQTAAAALSANSLSLLDGGGAGMMSSSYGSNDLWLELVAVTNGTALLLAHPPETGAAYDLFQSSALASNVWTWVARGLQGQTEFSVTNLPPDGAFYILGTMAGLDAHGVTTAYRSLVGGDETLANDTDNDGLRDAWEILHFGNLDQDGYGDYDGDSASNAAELIAGTDPNTVTFGLRFSAERTPSNSIPFVIGVHSGVPAQMTILVDPTNSASLSWSNFSPALMVDLDAGEGPREIHFGLRGRSPTSTPMWRIQRIFRDTSPPALVITSPEPGAGSKPMIQLRGYSPEPLAQVTFALTNSLGEGQEGRAAIVDQFFDTNLLALTTNWFECVDLPLGAGTNTVTLRAKDLAGNAAETICQFYSRPTATPRPPALSLTWPQDGMTLAGASFSLRGYLDDETATVSATLAGDTNNYGGFVERDGRFWLENLPLQAGTNRLAITATDAAGNSATTNLTLLGSPLALTMDPVSLSSLHQIEVSASGTLSDPSCSLTVNGIAASVDGTNWTAANVPVNAGGVATFRLAATAAPNEPPVELTVDEDKPPVVYVQQYSLIYTSWVRGVHTPTGELAETVSSAWLHRDHAKYDYAYTLGYHGDCARLRQPIHLAGRRLANAAGRHGGVTLRRGGARH